MNGRRGPDIARDGCDRAAKCREERPHAPDRCHPGTTSACTRHHTYCHSMHSAQPIGHSGCTRPAQMIHSPKRRIVGLAVALSLSTACSTAGSGGNPTQPTPLPGPGGTLTYSAVGASDVLGVGSSKPCFLFEDCNGNGYVWVAARQLRASS